MVWDVAAFDHRYDMPGFPASSIIVLHAQIEVSFPRFTKGGVLAWIKPVFVAEPIVIPFETLRLTLYIPGVLYRMFTGFCTFDEEGVPPGNDQDHEVGFPVERSVKFTLAMVQGVLVLAVKFATSGMVSISMASRLNPAPTPEMT